MTTTGDGGAPRDSRREAPDRNLAMELVRVTKSNLGDWARQLKSWGFTDVAPEYLSLPAASGASTLSGPASPAPAAATQ